ncbi:MAG: lysophospholipid acyltransferase family protein [bacterium]|nr:lysophospholipid acyltransferase family protein [bacterium]
MSERNELTEREYTRSDRERRDRSWLRAMRRARRAVAEPLVRGLGARGLRGLVKTWRVEALHPERRDRARAGHGGCIVVFWHGRMIPAFSQFMEDELTILVSVSDDGGLAVDLLERFGFEIVRGSSSKRGLRAMREMLDVLAGERTIVITPDGPRGPQHKVEPGLAYLARITGHPILPVGFATDAAWHLKSWDHFTIPKPRARVVAAFGEPVWVEPGAKGADLAATREAVGETLLALEREAAAELGLEVSA